MKKITSPENLLREELKEFRRKLKENLAKRHDAFIHGGDGWHDNFSFENLEMEYHYITSRIETVRRELKDLLAKPSSSSSHPERGEESSISA